MSPHTPSETAATTEGKNLSNENLSNVATQDQPSRPAAVRRDRPSGPGSVPPKEQGRAPRPRGGRPWWLLALVGVLAVAAIALGVVLIAQHHGSSNSPQEAALATREQSRQAAYDAAVRDAQPLFSYDYRTFDKDTAAASAVTTGDFTAQVKMLSGAAVKPLAVKLHATVKATVLGAAVLDDTNPDEIPVLVFVDQAVKNDQLAAPRLDRNRIRLTMRRVGTEWKVAAAAGI